MNTQPTETYAATAAAPLFRSLTATEVQEFREAARKDAIRLVATLGKEIHHPIYRDEITKCILRLAQNPPPTESIVDQLPLQARAKLFCAGLVLLVDKYIGKPTSGYSITNAISDHAHDSEFHEFAGEFDEVKQDYVGDMVVEARKALGQSVIL